MKKKILGMLALIALVVGLTGCGEKVTLDQIVEKFNNSETVNLYKTYGIDINAKALKDAIEITTSSGETATTARYDLKGNILSNNNVLEGDFMGAVILIDSIGQVHGYQDGELLENINAFDEEASKYTVANEGIEYEELKEGVSIKIDISKKVPLIDMSKFYLKPTEFDMIEEFVSENTTGNQMGKLAKIAYNLELGIDQNYIYIGETDELTESAYKSVLSALEVMYGPEVAKHFKEIYPNFLAEETTVEAFTIDPNYKIEIEEDEESVFEGMKVVQIMINNKDLK